MRDVWDSYWEREEERWSSEDDGHDPEDEQTEEE